MEDEKENPTLVTHSSFVHLPAHLNSSSFLPHSKRMRERERERAVKNEKQSSCKSVSVWPSNLRLSQLPLLILKHGFMEKGWKKKDERRRMREEEGCEQREEETFWQMDLLSLSLSLPLSPSLSLFPLCISLVIILSKSLTFTPCLIRHFVSLSLLILFLHKLTLLPHLIICLGTCDRFFLQY